MAEVLQGFEQKREIDFQQEVSSINQQIEASRAKSDNFEILKLQGLGLAAQADFVHSSLTETRTSTTEHIWHSLHTIHDSEQVAGLPFNPEAILKHALIDMGKELAQSQVEI